MAEEAVAATATAVAAVAPAAATGNGALTPPRPAAAAAAASRVSVAADTECEGGWCWCANNAAAVASLDEPDTAAVLPPLAAVGTMKAAAEADKMRRVLLPPLEVPGAEPEPLEEVEEVRKSGGPAVLLLLPPRRPTMPLAMLLPEVPFTSSVEPWLALRPPPLA